eukprot:g46190.t1
MPKKFCYRLKTFDNRVLEKLLALNFLAVPNMYLLSRKAPSTSLSFVRVRRIDLGSILKLLSSIQSILIAFPLTAINKLDPRFPKKFCL